MPIWVFQALARLVLAGLLVQFYLAGAAVFGAMTFEAHRGLGYLLAIAIVLLLVVTLVARPGRRPLGLTALLAGLTVLQVLLPSVRTGLPWLAALHVLVAVGLAVQAAAIARASTRATKTSSPPDTTGSLREALRGLSQ